MCRLLPRERYAWSSIDEALIRDSDRLGERQEVGALVGDEGVMPVGPVFCAKTRELSPLNGDRNPADQAGEPAGDGRDPSGIEGGDQRRAPLRSGIPDATFRSPSR